MTGAVGGADDEELYSRDVDKENNGDGGGDKSRVGKDIDTLAQKFMDEIGYSNSSPYSGAMLDLVDAGASIDIIDPEKYFYLVDVNQLDDCDANCWYDYFEGNGYDVHLINKFRR